MNSLIRIECALPTSLTTLDLSFNTKLDINSIFDLSIPSLEILKLSNCQITELPQKRPPWGWTIKTLKLDGNRLTSFTNEFSFFPNLEDLSLFGNDIQFFDFSQVPQQLNRIDLGMNDIQFFIDKSQIQTINLSYNKFRVFPTSILDFICIRCLSLESSDISGELDFTVPPQLAILDLTNNHITTLSPTFVASCGTLSILSLSHNLIYEIPDVFQENVHITQLFLDHNKLENVPTSLLQHAKMLERLNLSHNRLRTIPELHTHQLREFNVSFNKLKELPDSFSNCIFLIHMNLSNNLLTDLPQSLKYVPRLLELYINNNQFIKLPNCILSLITLNKLYISGNLLTSLPNCLNTFLFLKTLDLSNNHFQTLPIAIASLPVLKYLNISHNLITEVPKEFQFPESLILLDISYNLLQSFQSINLPSIVSLILSNNLIETFSISNSKDIHFLSLSNNNLRCTLNEILLNTNESKTFEFLEIINNKLISYEYNKEVNTKLHIISDDKIYINTNYNIGYSSTIGIRNNMEDSITLYSEKDLTILGIFDGHVGSIASKLSSELIIPMIKSILLKPLQFQNCLKELQNILIEKNINEGCTVAILYIYNNRIWSIGLGDTRILRIKRNYKYQRLTIDHKPLLKSEYKRLKKNGIGVSNEGRVKKKLSVARALGDLWCGEGLFELPGVISYKIDDDDIGIVIACDGVWDVLDDEDVVNIIMKSNDAMDAAVNIKNTAFALESRDNISVITLMFDNKNEEFNGMAYRNKIERIPVVEEEVENYALDDNREVMTKRGLKRRRR
ncbi:protein phosphatase 2C [Histomonas meleagridis]|uniref:protein phosphatase 2C n=1 Tax=Histomonas meleagridis TaxID=135588 RepID=UPI00355A08FA|nr:protein phosphatase 2C [Histomonas meleagridis]KAH0802007.1 protein phosphatase 2C [Histomonas meleagridis]